jgi:transcriptional regulator with XRE-family HTH domain
LHQFEEYAVICSIVQQHLGDQLRFLMDGLSLRQDQVAKAAKVSQSTVSRALRRGYLRQSRSRVRLEYYLSKTELKLHKRIKLPSDVTRAVREVWDKTDRHAAILAKVILALEGLTPRPNIKEHARKSRSD